MTKCSNATTVEPAPSRKLKLLSEGKVHNSSENSREELTCGEAKILDVEAAGEKCRLKFAAAHAS